MQSSITPHGVQYANEKEDPNSKAIYYRSFVMVRRYSAIVAPSSNGLSLSLQELKMVLLDSLIGTDRGLNMGSRLRGEVLEYINLLEAQNPTAKPTEASELLAGRWRLRFTAASELAVLRLPQQIPGKV